MPNDNSEPHFEKWRNIIAALAAIGAILTVAVMAAQTLVDVGSINQDGPNIDNSKTSADCSITANDVSDSSEININIGQSVCE